MQHAYAARQDASAEIFPAAEFARQTMAVAEADIRKLIRDPVELLTRMVQPALWLLIFGEVFTRIRAIPTGGIPYIDFMTPGILAQNVLFGAIFYGISLIWERDLGIVHKYLVSPSTRTALVMGRAISSTARAVCQMFLVYVLAISSAHSLALRSAVVGRGHCRGYAGRGEYFSTFSLIRSVHREVARPLHGHWTGADHATFFCQQRDLPVEHDARVATRFFAGEPADVSGGRAAPVDGRRWQHFLRSAHRFPGPRNVIRSADCDCRQTISADYHVIGI